MLEWATGRAMGWMGSRAERHPGDWVLGRDVRQLGEWLSAWVTAGIGIVVTIDNALRGGGSLVAPSPLC